MGTVHKFDTSLLLPHPSYRDQAEDLQGKKDTVELAHRHSRTVLVELLQEVGISSVVEPAYPFQYQVFKGIIHRTSVLRCYLAVLQGASLLPLGGYLCFDIVGGKLVMPPVNGSQRD